MSDPKIAMFLNMAESDPENELAHFSLGKLYFEASEYDSAKASLRRTLELNSQHTQAHRFLGETLLALSERDEGLEVLTAGIRLGHVRGEYMPRNAMIDILKREGVEPPHLVEDDEEDEAAGVVGGFYCKRCMRNGTPLDKAPFSSELGQQVLESICQECWKEWMAMSVKVINELRLNLATPEGSRAYDQHMREFLGFGME
ncbi:MAG: Fe(2+)-trafficking protein [Planctomycetota bacterium]